VKNRIRFRCPWTSELERVLGRYPAQWLRFDRHFSSLLILKHRICLNEGSLEVRATQRYDGLRIVQFARFLGIPFQLLRNYPRWGSLSKLCSTNRLLDSRLIRIGLSTVQTESYSAGLQSNSIRPSLIHFTRCSIPPTARKSSTGNHREFSFLTTSGVASKSMPRMQFVQSVLSPLASLCPSPAGA
jgi:hypothetical protein